jgi:hypothetical protein
MVSVQGACVRGGMAMVGELGLRIKMATGNSPSEVDVVS